MYEKDTKSETVLARAVHLLTLGAYAWGDDGVHSTSWRELGGGDIGSVFQHHQESASPNACDWINMALLREPSDVMNSEWEIAHRQLTVLVSQLLRRDKGIAGGGLKFGWSSARVCGNFPWWLGRGVSLAGCRGFHWRDCTRYGIERAVFLFLRIGALFEF